MLQVKIDNVPGKVLNCNLMNSNEEIKCNSCGRQMLVREMYMQMEVQDFDSPKKDKKLMCCCIDCTDKILDRSLEDINKWASKQSMRINNWRESYQAYLSSETYLKLKVAEAIDTNGE